MSWSSGTRLFSNIADIIATHVAEEDKRARIYREMIEEFEKFDCDTLRECYDIDSVLDEILDEYYGEDEVEDDDDDWPDGGREMF